MGSKNGKPVLRDQDVAMLQKSSGLTEKQVREAFEMFVAEHPYGRMTPKEFKDLMARALPGKDGAKMEKHVFRIYDTNNDGYIDFAEFMIIFIIMSDGSPKEVLSKLFRIYDLNSDGVITKKEMKKLIKDLYALLKADNPNIAAEAFIAKTAHEEMDRDSDGKITNEEFISACMDQEEITKMLTLKLVDIFVEERAS